jgi:hypothetical protein
MSRPLIGQVLARMGKVTPIDIDEILVEQTFSQRRFGEIALTWGLCETADVREAWCDQLHGGDHIDLSDPQIDPAAVGRLQGHVARRLGVVPLKLIGDVLIVACARPVDAAEMPELVRAAGHDIRFIQANWEELARALDRHYPQTIVDIAA